MAENLKIIRDEKYFCFLLGHNNLIYVFLSDKGKIVTVESQYMFHSSIYSGFVFMSSIFVKLFHLAKVLFNYVKLCPAIGSAGAPVLPMKSVLKSKIFCESEGEVHMG